MTDNSRTEAIGKLAKLIKDIRIAMLTTVETDGTLRSRPMGVQQVEFDGDLWFFTQESAPKVDDVRHDQEVNVSFAEPSNQTYVSMSGKAQIVRDQAKIKELWNPVYKAWFPKGLDDPDLALMKVNVTQAEYWDSHSGLVVSAIGLAKVLITGERYDGGENEKLELSH